MGTYPGIGAVIRGFHAAVQNQGEPPVSAADGRVVVDLLEQLWTRTHDARATVTRPRPTAPRPSSNGSTVLVTGASGLLRPPALAPLRQRGPHAPAPVPFPPPPDPRPAPPPPAPPLRPPPPPPPPPP